MVCRGRRRLAIFRLFVIPLVAQWLALPVFAWGQETLVDEPGYLGLIADDRQEENGVRIVEIIPESPAHGGGLIVGDLVITINDHPIRDMSDMARVMQRSQVGTELIFSVERDRQYRHFRVTLGERPSAEERAFPDFGQIQHEPGQAPAKGAVTGNNAPWLGIRARTLPEDLAGRPPMPSAGVFVTEVMQRGPADRAGIRPGNVIVGLNGTPVGTSTQLSELVAGLTIGQEYAIDFIRDGQPTQTAITVSRRGDYQAGPSEFPGGPSRPIPSVPPLEWNPPDLHGPQPQDPATPDSQRIQQLEHRIEQLERQLDQIEQQIRTLLDQ